MDAKSLQTRQLDSVTIISVEQDILLRTEFLQMAKGIGIVYIYVIS
jgi:hypothetical protein